MPPGCDKHGGDITFGGNTIGLVIRSAVDVRAFGLLGWSIGAEVGFSGKTGTGT